MTVGLRLILDSDSNGGGGGGLNLKGLPHVLPVIGAVGLVGVGIIACATAVGCLVGAPAVGAGAAVLVGTS